jgi:hypothetical protein
MLPVCVAAEEGRENVYLTPTQPRAVSAPKKWHSTRNPAGTFHRQNGLAKNRPQFSDVTGPSRHRSNVLANSAASWHNTAHDDRRVLALASRSGLARFLWPTKSPQHHCAIASGSLRRSRRHTFRPRISEIWALRICHWSLLTGKGSQQLVCNPTGRPNDYHAQYPNL